MKLASADQLLDRLALAEQRYLVRQMEGAAGAAEQRRKIQRAAGLVIDPHRRLAVVVGDDLDADIVPVLQVAHQVGLHVGRAELLLLRQFFRRFVQRTT